MTQLFILSAMSVTGAVIAIIGMLLIAGVIGYVTAWFYAKSVYTPIIKGLQRDKDNLTEQVAALNRKIEVMNGEIKNLSAAVETQVEKIKKLEIEVEEKKREIMKMTKPVKES
jgi:peptidoglycan hydrolase CwlO-like protein